MKIAFDAKRLFNNHTGLGNYSRTLVDNLSHNYPDDQYFLLAPNTQSSEYLSTYNDYRIIDPKPKFSSLWRSLYITDEINKIAPDIYHGLSNELPFNAKKIIAKKIVTIHDLFFEKFPQDFTSLDRAIYKKKTKDACLNADHIVAISEATKRDIIEIFGIDHHKITVVYQSCSSVFQSSGLANPLELPELPSEFALYVGTINKRKNLEGILKAMLLIPVDHRIPLVVVGEGSAKYVRKIKNYILENQLGSHILFIGRLSNSLLSQIYKKARFFCLPSFYEGFGIPVIESLFSGTPVITANTSSLPEAAGNCGYLVDPFSQNELSSALQNFTESDDLLNKLKQNIPQHIRKFTSRKTADKLQSLYNSVV